MFMGFRYLALATLLFLNTPTVSAQVSVGAEKAIQDLEYQKQALMEQLFRIRQEKAQLQVELKRLKSGTDVAAILHEDPNPALTKEVRLLEERISFLTQELSRNEATISLLQETNSTLKNKLAQTEKRTDQVNSSLLLAKEKELTKLQTRITALEAQLSQAAKEKVALEAQTKIRAEKKAEGLSKRVEELKKENALLGKKLSGTQKKYDESERRIAQLTKTNNTLHKELKSSSDRQEKFEKESVSALQQLEKKDGEFLALKKELESSQQKNRDFQKNFQSVNGQIRSLLQERQGLNEELREARGKIDELETITLIRLSEAEKKYEEQLQVYRGREEQYLISLRRLEKDINRLTINSRNLNQIESDEKVTEVLEGELAQLRDQLKNNEQLMFDQLNEFKTSLESKTLGFKKEINELQRIVTERDERIAQLVHEKTMVTLAFEKLTKERDALSKDLAFVIAKIDKAETEAVKRIEKAKVPLQTSIHFLEKKLLNTEEQLQSKDREIDKTLQKEIQLKAMLKQAHDVNQELHTEIQKLAKQISIKEDEVNRKVKKATTPLQEKVDTLSSQLKENEKVITEQAVLIGQLKQKHDSSQQKILAIRQDRSSLQETLNILKEKLQNIEKERERVIK